MEHSDRLWNTLSQVQGLQTIGDGLPWVERQVLDTFARMYERFEQDRQLIPDGHLAELHYEELIADPVGQMQSVYEQLDLGGFNEVRPEIAQYAADHSSYRPAHYSLSPATAERVRRHWAPWENGYAESFHSRFRDECLATEEFENVVAARRISADWRQDYNHHRPHSSLGYRTPAEFAARWAASAPKLLSATPPATSPLQQPSGLTQPVLS